MLNIDLLKGQGIPIKSRPGGAVLLAVTIAIPVVITLVILGDYIQSTIILSTQRQILKNTEAKIAALSDALETQEAFKKQLANIDSCLIEVGCILKQRTQWSPVLRVLAENIPQNLTLSELSARTMLVRESVQKRDAPEQTVVVNLPKRALKIILYGKKSDNSDKAVSVLLENLNSSPVLAPKVENIRLISQTTGKDKTIMHYAIECLFKHK